MPSQGWERERRIGHRVTSKCISHIEAKVKHPAVASAQNGPKHAAYGGLAGGGSGEATGLLGRVPPACQTFSTCLPQEVSRTTYKDIVV